MLTISTFNIKNDSSTYRREKAERIIEYLEDNQIDILNLQELFPKCERDLRKELQKRNYKIYGKYRYYFPWFSSINESNAIITNQPVIFHKTYYLPSFPSFTKRVATKVVIQNEKIGTISIINTHLDYQYDYVKKKQLKYLQKLIEKDKNPILLTGDFNLKNNKELFFWFENVLQEKGIFPIKTKGKTLKQSRYHRAIDHIFISQDFEILKAEIIKTLSISDHYPILVKLIKRSD